MLSPRRRTRTEIVATALNEDIADTRDRRYQQGWTTPVPIWSTSNGYIAVASAAERVKLDRWSAARGGGTWTLHPDTHAQAMAGAMSPARVVVEMRGALE